MMKNRLITFGCVLLVVPMLAACGDSVSAGGVVEPSESSSMAVSTETDYTTEEKDDEQSNITSNSIDENTSDGTGSNLVVSNDGSAAAEGSWDDVIDEPEKTGGKIDYNIEVENGDDEITDYTQLAIYQTAAGKDQIDYLMDCPIGTSLPAIAEDEMGIFKQFKIKDMDLATAQQEFATALVEDKPTNLNEIDKTYQRVVKNYIKWDEYVRAYSSGSGNSGSSSGGSSQSSGPQQASPDVQYGGLTPEEAAELAASGQYDDIYSGGSDWFHSGWDTNSSAR